MINELIQRYRLVTYDYFANEVSAWDVPIWYLKHQDEGFTATLLPYKSWDDKPVTIEDGEQEGGPPKVEPFQYATLAQLDGMRSDDATPGEFELLDARSLMERGDYTGAVRRTVTAIEAALEWALVQELLSNTPKKRPRGGRRPTMIFQEGCGDGESWRTRRSRRPNSTSSSALVRSGTTSSTKAAV